MSLSLSLSRSLHHFLRIISPEEGKEKVRKVRLKNKQAVFVSYETMCSACIEFYSVRRCDDEYFQPLLIFI
jgi:hypothetical protein